MGQVKKQGGAPMPHMARTSLSHSPLKGGRRKSRRVKQSRRSRKSRQSRRR